MTQLSGNNKTPKTALGKRTRDKLLQAAEIEFDAEYRWRNGKQMVVVTEWIKSL